MINDKRFACWALALILLIGFLSYSNSLHGPFVFDDITNIVNTDGVHLNTFDVAGLKKLGQRIVNVGRPVVQVSFALNYYFGKLNTFGYHLINLLIHLSCACLLYFFVKLTLNLPSLQDLYGEYSHKTALLTSLLFVVHLIQTQAVTYIVQRTTSMAALFFLVSIFCYVKGRLAEGARVVWLAGAAITALLALGSKQNSITLPFFILLYEYYFIRRIQSVQDKKKLFYTICGLLILMIFLVGIYTDFDLFGKLSLGYQKRSFTPVQGMLTQLRVVIYYISLLLVPLPSRLSLEHYFPLSYSLLNPPATLVCSFLVIGIIGSSIYLAKKKALDFICPYLVLGQSAD